MTTPYGLIHAGDQTQDDIDPQHASGSGGPQPLASGGPGFGGPQPSETATRVVRGEELDQVLAEVARMQRSIDRMMTLMENSAIFQPPPLPSMLLFKSRMSILIPLFPLTSSLKHRFRRTLSEARIPVGSSSSGPGRPGFSGTTATAPARTDFRRATVSGGRAGDAAGTHAAQRRFLLGRTRRQGIIDVYGDLAGQPFVLPTLSSVLVFLEGLITVFGDKFMRENAKRALEACKQRNLTIGEYNSQFKSLVYLVEDIEATRIEKYTAGLNPRIIRKAMSKQWTDAQTLDEKMELASDAAAQLDILALLPPDPPMGNQHHPLSSSRVVHPPPPPPRPQRDHDAMEIDATKVVPAAFWTRPGPFARLGICVFDAWRR
ncbi:hypothetical protein PGTUg99_007968 [Puccinia graminis f. sp. tritici]|uniref:Retrotransposon gag domain-containing protein n=1 Tax=Puccinia graminis f. sp. tritici TaxID=56615 RepID=A0A5B0S8W6_PUCGR|nr:hypothetical protein PGTUg99_007968 [Puccinia graminis f. sp. tritici]